MLRSSAPVVVLAGLGSTAKTRSYVVLNAGKSSMDARNAETFTTFAYGVAEERRWLLCDAMTSGGLLAATPNKMDEGWVVGRLVEGEPGTITVA